MCRCALHLLKEDASELLRRLSIICLEDAILHPHLPLIVWLMAAQSKVTLLSYLLHEPEKHGCLLILANLLLRCDLGAYRPSGWHNASVTYPLPRACHRVASLLYLLNVCHDGLSISTI